MCKGSSQIKFELFIRIDKDCVDIAVWSDLVANTTSSFSTPFWPGTVMRWTRSWDILKTLESEGICRLTKGNQTFHIVTALDIFRISFTICSFGPIKLVDCITRVVRVMDK